MKIDKYSISAIVILSLIGFSLISQNKVISVSEIGWNCEHKICNVSFRLQNRIDDYLKINISIKAYRYEYVSGSDAMLSKLVGEEIFEYKMYPNEAITINKDLKVVTKFRPVIVTVNARKSD